jgi:predicted ATP-dependent serine protease
VSVIIFKRLANYLDRISTGQAVWGFPVRQCEVMYLCLEDTFPRIQRRMYRLNEEPMPELRFAVMCDKLHGGLEEQIAEQLRSYPNTGLIIIDTLQMVRGAYDQSYASDYRDLSSLKKLADAHGFAILLIHHLRKEPSDDVFSRISGTTAISGAVDTSLTLVETERGSGEATLYCIGRDIEYGELELERDEDNVWRLRRDSRTTPKSGKKLRSWKKSS